MKIKPILIAAIFCAINLSASAQQTKPTMRGQYAYLEIMHEHQRPNLCLPTCVAMTMNYYGDGKTQYTLKRLSNEHKDIFSGTSFEEIQDGIKKIGYTWDRWKWHNDSAGFHNAIDAIEQSLDYGKPVIVSIKVPLVEYRRNRYHALLAFGYDAKEHEIFILDPARQFPGKRHITFDELREMWDEDGALYGLFTARMGEMPTGHRLTKLADPYVNH